MTAMPSPDPRLAAAATATMPVAQPTPVAAAGKTAKKGKGDAAGGDAPPKKKKTKLIIGLVVVLALVGFKEKGMFIKPHYTAAHPAPNGTVYPLPTTNPFTVTTADGHTVQTDVALQLTTVASTKTLTVDEPAIEAIVVSVLGSMTYAELLPPSGRQAAAAAMLTRIQRLLGPVDGSPQVTKVLFTGTFVLQ
jgi:flagellar basal body-associated protein FliL